MERTRSVPSEGKILWKKTGKGIFKLRNRIIIRSGEEFWAYPHEIPMAFRDNIVPVFKEEEKKLDPGYVAEEKIAPHIYTKKKRETSNFYDIFDSEGKKVNEKALREEQADDYLKSLL